MSYALAASYLFILLITLTLSKALDITILLTYLKSASFFSFCYAILFSLTKLLYLLGIMLRNKSNEYKGLVNKDLKLLKQKISVGY
ncbi:hypothetical protein HBH95_180840 [Parastagonospora nodorum]|nr:hypothetical protein HBH95_180840 [Parastagonospora nodorum]